MSEHLPSEQSLSGAEVLEHLRRVIRGELSLQILGQETWDEAFSGNVVFHIGEMEVTFFNDAGGLDYVDCARDEKGRTWVYDILSVEEEPLDLMPEEEFVALFRLVREAKPS